jgi:hypothetical protein
MLKKHNNPRKEDDRTASIQNVMASLTPNVLCQFCLMRELSQKMLPYNRTSHKENYGHSHTVTGTDQVTDADCSFP